MIKACVIGWPVAHSRSPMIHGYWLRHHGIDGNYGREEVRPEAAPAFLRSLAERGLAGCNVTVPLKEIAFSTVEPADDATRRLGAVNTIFLKDGAVLGTNTDGEGFLANVAAHVPEWRAEGMRIAILGAGGAARAIAGALIDQGAQVSVINRTRDRAEQLARGFGMAARAFDWRDLAHGLEGANLIVNATVLGMKGQPALDLDPALLPRDAIVADIVYTPLETPLIEATHARGHRTVPGLGMLLHQAVRGFELWFGVRPEVTRELHDLVAANIRGP